MLGVDPNDEVRETIINYVEEGCPDVDQVCIYGSLTFQIYINYNYLKFYRVLMILCN